MILQFRLGEVDVLARSGRANGTSLVTGHAVEFVGLEAEGDVISAVVPSQDLEQCGAEGRMSRNV